MEISNFELLIQRLAPGPATQLNRRVVQGYFLSLTNLENRDLNIVVRVTASSTGAGAASILRDLIPGLFGNTGFPAGTNAGLIFDNAPTAPVNLNNRGVSLLDITQIVNGAAGSTNTRVFQSPIINIQGAFQNVPTIGAKQTVLLALLPNIGLITAQNPNPTVEVRGFIEVFQLFGGEPAKIMVSAEHRGTFLDNAFPNAGGAQDFDQITYPVALSHGKGIIEI